MEHELVIRQHENMLTKLTTQMESVLEKLDVMDTKMERIAETSRLDVGNLRQLLTQDFERTMKDVTDRILKNEENIVDIRIEMGKLKVKSGLIGLIGGALVVALQLIIQLIKNG